MNSLDIALFEYAQSLVSKRLSQIPKITQEITQYLSLQDTQIASTCGAKIRKLPRELDGQLGIHRPSGHKAPLK